MSPKIILLVVTQTLVFGTAYASAFLAQGQTNLQEDLTGKARDTVKFSQQEKAICQTISFGFSATTESKQIPLCMIGDSITWAGKGDHWRKELLKRMPNLAFIGTHTAVAGYSHAGEGGNNTKQVLRRIEQIPDCPNYNLLIGTNNNGVKTAEEVEPKAGETALSIVEIVNALLEKPAVKKVFLSSILPCHTDNPLRDQCNSSTNRILRAEFADAFPAGNVVWVEYEIPLRIVDGWEEKIRLHPTPEGYNLIADITARSIASALDEKQGQSLVRPANSGVRIVNLMKTNRTTRCPMIAGWYTLSFKVTAVSGDKAAVVLQRADSIKRFPFQLTIPIEASEAVSNQERAKNFFTQYEQYSYSRDFMDLKAIDCTISEVMLEKSRPLMKPSIYGTGTFIDTQSPTSAGELLEFEK